MRDFDKWFEAQGYIEDDGCYQEKYLAARDAWLAQEERLASDTKARMVKLLREGLL